MGKTALAAEVVNLWHQQFDFVLVVQSRGRVLNAEAFYQQMDSLLVRLSKVDVGELQGRIDEMVANIV